MIYEHALNYANEIFARVQPTCDRLELVGSLKRADKREVGDIEFLLIPKDQRPVAAFGKPKEIYNNLFEKVLADMEGEGIIKQSALKKCDGPKQKRRVITAVGGINEFCVEFFIVSPDTWGVMNVIRTGPAMFSHCFVTNKSQIALDRSNGDQYRGLLPDKYQYIPKETKIKYRNGGEVLSLPEERDAIELLGFGWIAPRDRGAYALKRAVRR